ncbi:iron uptake transporter deferrochelatase/peroxidase subunit [Saccharopolyspora phatthalungensis]|uniref:Deferrochelatase n=1 Tax=Saccharopolyspora phatthalungensis TaxID=664693 RepID=A0A840QAG6_9PSEU|nr:iron uptake transporter deferrochelatase/peroxidase subunit [Saccharopolyspora phatthalungensis]MBB5156751.1 deferrochelatase/peroxidase EfeB [Saccharopolyspora phatthalungensis]
MTGVSRRRLFGMTGAGVAIAGTAAGTGYFAASRPDETAATVPFRGPHQAGITTPAQDRMHFVAFDVTTTDRAELAALLRDWTQAAERMTAGLEAIENGAVGGRTEAPPGDTGEALDLPASALTLTIGFGPSLFDGRFGLGDRRPAALLDLPHFPADNLDPARSSGDLCVQACANDPQVAVHAVRNLARIGFGKVAVRWSQLGFGRTSTTSRAQSTPRNLFGFKDGTNNLKAEDTAELDRHVWVQPGDGPEWMSGGTYLVARRIRMHIETWDRTSLAEQEAIVGRAKGSGAPNGAAEEFDPVDLQARSPDGEFRIAADAHIRLAAPATHGGVRMLRRGYNFTDGSDGLGRLDAGLFFVCFNRDPRTQFVPVQRMLSKKDAMMEYLEHTGSAIFACPPGVPPGGHWGDSLFG